MPTTYVSLDLETTGLSSERDAIIEVGAVKFRGEEVLETFETFVNPGRPIPNEITELTGIVDADVATAPGIGFVLPRVGHFLGDLPMIGHSVGFDLAFLRQAAERLNQSLFSKTPSIDTFELAGILLPEAERYSLIELTRVCEVEVDEHHRALDDAMATMGLFLALMKRAASLPTRLLEELTRHGQRAQWEPATFFAESLEYAAHHPAAPDAMALPEPTQRPAFAPPAGAEPLEPEEMLEPLDVEKLATLLEQDGAFAAQFPDYEYRPQQISMLRTVAEALSDGGHVLLEAPTGVGKSLAYLIPAVQWAVQNNARTVISTNTINLQEQLFRKDLPSLAQVLPVDFHATVLKGRSHYLCPSRLAAMRRTGPRSTDEARVLAKVLIWLQTTRTGDGDDMFLPSAIERGIWAQLSAEYDGCDPERCQHAHRGTCFYYAARDAAEASHIIIVNHALLLADVAVENRALPNYDHLIVDEAHHLEDATTNSLSFEIDHVALQRMLSQIGMVSTTGRVTGLLGDVLAATRTADIPAPSMERLELFVGKIGVAAARARRSLDDFFDRLTEFVEEHIGGSGRYGLRARIDGALRIQPAWDGVEIAWDDANVPIVAAVDALKRLASNVEEMDARGLPGAEELATQITGLARSLAEAGGHLNQFITQPSPSVIYWLEAYRGNERLRLRAAPLHVGPLVQEHIFHKKRAVILTSATLRTSGSFDYVRERLHAWDAEELAVDSPFDYEASTLVYLIDDIPEPGTPGYQKAVEQGMAELFRRTEGRALGLFTSYSQLRSTYRAIRAPLEAAGITVQAQGEGISRAQLLNEFRGGDRRVLLGTRSFWEGVDVPGEALSCLAIAKLPFGVPSDPVFAARSETFDDPFFQYAVPQTILRFLQGFGRLIRTSSDRGVVVVFDRRLLTKSYGDLFIESLPSPTIRRGSLVRLPHVAEEWIEIESQ